MGGGLMQLVAYGAQDIYLTGNPQITFFKVVYRRHTNFSMESIEQTFNGSVGAGARLTATVSRNGDLVHKMYLASTVAGGGDSANYGHFGLISEVELEIGGQRIDKQTAQWMETWAQLTEVNPLGTAATNSAGMTSGTMFQKMSAAGGCSASGGTLAPGLIHVPLQFWFCRNAGLALPLIALQYHEVKVILDHVVGSVLGAGASNTLWCDYIYLDTDERRRFAQVSHEYLIAQIQEQSLTATSGAHDLNFNHPVKELIWSTAAGDAGSATGTSLIATSAALTDTFQLKLNGHDRFAARDYKYFSRLQPWQYHSGAGGLDSSSASGQGRNDSICVYSFALKPEEHQPSGTCNFSRIDNAQLVSSGVIVARTTLYAVNYNVLRIMSGMGGLAYSN